MSKTRNQRRRSRWRYRILLALLAAIMVTALAVTIVLWVDIERRSRELAERSMSGSVIRAGEYLPEGWSADSPGWVAAMQRYNVEEGLLLPQLTTEEAE